VINFAYAIPALPLLGFFVLVFFGKRLGDPRAGWIGAGAIGLSFLATLVTWLGLLTREGEFRRYDKHVLDWIHVGGLELNISLLVDPLSMVMAMFVTGVAFLIHMYSVGYMKGDSRYHQFFVYLNLFVFSMLMLVLADNFALMFLGWEGVGACSYYLVGFWFERSSAATAAKKAFIVNRVGDAGLMLGMFVIYSALGSLTFYASGTGALERANELTSGTLTAAALLLFIGAVGKSAQLPLHVWLPDAMEGPTPVSALIHAATMVTAGVYLMVRVAPILSLTSDAAEVVAIVGAVSALFAATIACAQNDIKRVLAYSTMSQLGYMFLAVGAGAYSAGIFHMVTHAFFKALLFMGAGAVIHALHEEQDLKRMGNLRKYLPVTYVCFMIGWLAISGIFPFSGFWSKDDILLSVWQHGGTLYRSLWVVGMVTVLLTAYYMSRLFFLAFTGKDRWDAHTSKAHAAPAGKAKVKKQAVLAHTASAPHEAPFSMRFPIIVLAVLSAIGGLLELPYSWCQDILSNFLEPVLGPSATEAAHTATGTTVALACASMGLAIVGILLSAVIAKASPLWPRSLEPTVLSKAWYVDTLYSWMFERPGRVLANVAAFFIDNKVIDGAVNGSGRLVTFAGAGLRRVQTGFVRAYALSVAGGTLLVLVWALIRSTR
jgi:NADH-quinone oxidoreductase subunit L